MATNDGGALSRTPIVTFPRRVSALVPSRRGQRLCPTSTNGSLSPTIAVGHSYVSARISRNISLLAYWRSITIVSLQYYILRTARSAACVATGPIRRRFSTGFAAVMMLNQASIDVKPPPGSRLLAIFSAILTTVTTAAVFILADTRSPRAWLIASTLSGAVPAFMRRNTRRLFFRNDAARFFFADSVSHGVPVTSDVVIDQSVFHCCLFDRYVDGSTRAAPSADRALATEHRLYVTSGLIVLTFLNIVIDACAPIIGTS